MKKFLSLALSLIMVLSLVAVNAGAVEYKELTDKNEIEPKYEEAVAVLNRLGIISGFTDGSFRPESELNRGQAAKIIVSLLIGSEAADALPSTTSPYPDVPANDTFTSYISFCKNEGIINGYGDGTFRATEPLTGYAFSKMLLTALGYDGTVEGFTGSGWTMRVATLAHSAGLFDRVTFNAGENVTRQVACQLALNTLKATEVEYNGSGSTSITIAGVPVDIGGTQKWSYKTSNQDFAKNIKIEQSQVNQSGWYTLEFGEEHFVDLRLNQSGDIHDKYGRPSNEWSYKKVTIGTFPVDADFTYNTQVEHNVTTVTNATKVRSLGLGGFELQNDEKTRETTVWFNGQEVTFDNRSGADNSLYHLYDEEGKFQVGRIADFTDNGTLVEVYVSDDDADWITDVVVIQTQLMEVSRIGSDYVALNLFDDGSDDMDGNDPFFGYNMWAINENVNNVESGDECYTFLSGLKTGDLVAVVPYTENNGVGNYEVGKAYTPETVSGELTAVDNYGSRNDARKAITATVGGTTYKIAVWNKDLADIDGDKIKVTRTDVTLWLDEYGNALRANNVGATSDFMIIGSFGQALVNGKIVNVVEGWDIGGTKLELNVGRVVYNGDRGMRPGDLVYYTNEGTTNDAEWVLSELGVYDVTNSINSPTANYEIKASNSRVSLYGYPDGMSKTPVTDKGVKTIYVTFEDDGSGDVASIEIVNGLRAVSPDELIDSYNLADAYNPAQACVSLKGTPKSVTNESAVKAVVVKNDNNAVNVANVLYISEYLGGAGRDTNGNIVYKYRAAVMGPNGLVDDDMDIYSEKLLGIGDFARYTEAEREGYAPYYDLKEVTGWGKNASVMEANLWYIVNANNGLLKLFNYYTKAPGHANYYPYSQLGASGIDSTRYSPYVADTVGQGDLGIGDESHVVDVLKAEWVDLTGNNIDSASDLKNVMENRNWISYDLEFLFNDNPDSDAFRTVYMVVVVAGRSATGTNSIQVPGHGNTRYAGNTDAIDYVQINNGATRYSLNDIALRNYNLHLNDVLTLTLKNATATVTVSSTDGYTANTAVRREGTNIWDVTIHEDTAASGATVVITIGGAGGGDPEGPTGVVSFAKDLTIGDAGVGTLAEGATVETLASGATTASFTINKPSWASALGGEHDVVEIAYDIYVNDVKWSTGDQTISSQATGLTANAAKTAFTANIDVTGTNLTPSDVRNADGTTKKVSLVITKVDWKYALVEYIMNGEPVNVFYGASGSSAHLSTSTADRIYTKLNIEKVNNAVATYSITGIVTDGLTTSQYQNLAWDGSTQKQQHTDKVMIAAGGETVKVVIDMKTETTTLYSVKGAGDLDSNSSGVAIAGHFGVPSSPVSATAETAKLQIVALSEVKEGNSAAVEIKLDGAAADKGVYQYVATLTVGDQEITEVLSNSGGNKFVINNVTSDIEITEDMITIERIEKPHVVSYDVKGNTLSLTFNMPVAFADGASLGGSDSSKVQQALSRDGMTLTFTITEDGTEWGTDVADDTIGIGAAKIHAADTVNGGASNTNPTIVVTITTGTKAVSINTTWT